MSVPAQRPIFMIGWEFPPLYTGGLGIACAGLSRGLLENGEELIFALPTPLPPGIAYRKGKYQPTPYTQMETLQVNAHLYPYSSLSSREVSLNEAGEGPEVNGSYSTTSDIVAESQRYGEVVAQVAPSYDPPKVVHAHDWLSVPAALKVRQQIRKPLVLQIHSTEFDRSGGGSPHPQIAELEWQGLTEADKIIAVSQYTKQLIIEKYGIPADKIEVVHNGVDPNPEYHAQPLPEFLSNRPVVVFIGRLTIQKGPEYFLAVAKRVIAQEPKAIFVLAGDGELYQSLLVSAAAQGLSSSVLFAGFLRDKEKDWLYRRASVFVMPSVSEPFGIAALEAALVRTPVIISKNAGVREVLPHAISVDFWDIKKMTEEVLRLIRHPQTRARVGEQISQEARQQGWKSAAQKVQAVYEELE